MIAELLQPLRRPFTRRREKIATAEKVTAAPAVASAEVVAKFRELLVEKATISAKLHEVGANYYVAQNEAGHKVHYRPDSPDQIIADLEAQHSTLSSRIYMMIQSYPDLMEITREEKMASD